MLGYLSAEVVPREIFRHFLLRWSSVMFWQNLLHIGSCRMAFCALVVQNSLLVASFSIIVLGRLKPPIPFLSM